MKTALAKLVLFACQSGSKAIMEGDAPTCDPEDRVAPTAIGYPMERPRPRGHSSPSRSLFGLVVGLLLVSAHAHAAEPSAAPATFTNSVGMKLVAVEPGSYLCYGKPIKPVFFFPKPKEFQVKIDQPFCIGATEVTRAQYAKVMGLKTGWFEKDLDQPVTKVSWNDAMEFCRRLSDLPAEKAAGRVYSLPSEREWQYAARAGSEFLFPYGSDDEMKVAEVAVCRDIYTGALPTGPAAVGSKKPNAWGLYDVLGNAWEWVQDAWNPTTPPSAVPTTPGAAALDKGENRVIVGGGWDGDCRMCNLAARYSAPPTRIADNIGFRVRCEVRTAGK